MSENKPESSWEAIAGRASVEQDSQKLIDLANQLIEALNQEEQDSRAASNAEARKPEPA